jgi:autotransporter-associated beta strand protein
LWLNESVKRASPAALLASLALLSVLSEGIASRPAAALTLTVTSADDAGSGTLRDAINQANASVEDDTILFDFTDATSIELASSLPEVMGSITIDASEQDVTLVGPTDDSEALIVDSDAFALLRELEIEGDVFRVRGDGVLAIARNSDDTTTIFVTGNGAFEKRGGAELAMSGTNSYSGGSTVRSGTLRGDLQSLQGDISIRDGALLVFDIVSNGTYTGDLDGQGQLGKAGSGTLTLTGTDTHSGGTVVAAGRLVASTDSLQGEVEIDEGAELELSQASDGTYVGDLFGQGELVKSGTATLVLTGDNSYHGGTTVEAGTLEGDASSLQGDIAVDSGASVAFDQTGSGTYAGDLSGEGALVKRGSGTLVLSGSTSHSGGTSVEEGTLRGDTGALQGTITASTGATVAFDQAGNGTFAGQIAGGGAVRKLGAGRLTIDQDQSYTGGTRVEAGTLALRAVLAGDVVVSSGATLTGDGSVGGELDAGGRVEPDAFQTLSVGSARFRSGSRLVVAVDDTGASSGVAASGAATIAGGVVQIEPEDGDYSGGVTATVLSAAGGVSGAGFSGTLPDLPFLETTLSSDANNVFVTLQTDLADLADFARTSNQEAVGRAFDEMVSDGSSDVDTVVESLAVLSSGDEVPPLLESLAGDELSAFQTSRLADAERFARSLSARFDALRLRARARSAGAVAVGSPSAPSLVPAGPLAGSAAWHHRLGLAAPVGVSLGSQEGDRWGAFLDGYGLFGRLEGGGAKDVDYDVYGPVAGFDYALTDAFVLGVSVGYARTALEAGSISSGDADSLQGALYASLALPRFHLGAALRGAGSSMEAERKIVFSSLSRRARSDFDGWDASGYLEAGYAFGDPGRFEVEPLAALLYTHGAQEKFRERGAGSLDLEVARQDFDSLLSILGVRLRGNYPGGEVFRFLPFLRAAWQHEYLDVDHSVDARFTGARSGGAFTVVGAETPRDTALVGVGWDVGISDRSSFQVSYDARVNADFVEHAVSLGLRVSF